MAEESHVAQDTASVVATGASDVFHDHSVEVISGATNIIDLEFWIGKLILNIASYALPVACIYMLVYLLRRRGYFTERRNSLFSKCIYLLVEGYNVAPTQTVRSERISTVQQRGLTEYGILLLCFCGLMTSYLIWGILQEKIMTRHYVVVEPSGDTRQSVFRDSQFLVLLNRLLAFCLSGAYLLGNIPAHSPPLYKFSYASISNIMSSWCQYEALKYISFPTQVLGKACKIIPVMIMGFVIQRKKYSFHQYLTAGLLSTGVSMFLASRGQKSRRLADVTTLSGVILMAGYLFFDSFTTNWQDQLFKQYGVGEMYMMCCVNFFSLAFTLMSELGQLKLAAALEFMWLYPRFLLDALVMSVCSAVGQLFIFATISRYGAATFTIMMTVRQALSIFLSSLIFGHTFTPTGLVGIAVVFLALLLKVYLDQINRRINSSNASNTGQTVPPLVKK